jgi:hypothetical protein
MGKGPSGKSPKESKNKKVTAKKLDFLLDTIDTEVADLADVVEVEGPILDDEAMNQETEAIGFNDNSTAMNSLELDVDAFDESRETQLETKSVDNRAQAAIDAMSEAEGEIEAMLAEADSVSEDSVTTAGEVTNDGEMDLAQALDELLATREVDVSKLIEETRERTEEKHRARLRDTQGESVKGAGDRLSDDLFVDLDSELELETKDSGNKKDQAIPEKDKPVDDLQLNLQVEKERGALTKEGAVEAGLARDLLETSEFQRSAEQKEEGGSEVPPSATSSDEQLAELLSHKIEALVFRLVEERLAEIAERVIKERINKIFSSMK